MSPHDAEHTRVVHTRRSTRARLIFAPSNAEHSLCAERRIPNRSRAFALTRSRVYFYLRARHHRHTTLLFPLFISRRLTNIRGTGNSDASGIAETPDRSLARNVNLGRRNNERDNEHDKTSVADGWDRAARRCRTSDSRGIRVALANAAAVAVAAGEQEHYAIVKSIYVSLLLR